MALHSPVMQEFFEQLRDYRLAAAAERRALADAIVSRYGGERTILIGDMAGFTRRVISEGIVHYLSLIGEMRSICGPVVEGQGGYLFKAEADNIFAAFFSPEQGIDAALEIQRRVQAMNAACPECDQLEVELGLAAGPVLAVGVEDVWGSPVNFAAKLGEDIADAGEILAHESLEEPLRRRGLQLSARQVEVSRHHLRYFQVHWS